MLRISRLALVVPFAVVTGVAGSAIAPPASAAPATPPGTVRITPAASSAEIDKPRLVAANSKYVVWKLQTSHRLQAEPVDGGPVRTLGVQTGSYLVSLSGTKLLYSLRGTANTLTDLSTGQGVAVDPRWRAASPDGGVWTATSKADHQPHAYRENASTRVVTDLGSLHTPGQSKPETAVVSRAGDAAALFRVAPADDSGEGDLVLVSYATNKLTRLNPDLSYCELTLAGSVCARVEPPSQTFHLQRLSTAGMPTATVTVHLPFRNPTREAFAFAINPYLTASTVGWTYTQIPVDTDAPPSRKYYFYSVPIHRPAAPPVRSVFTVAQVSSYVYGERGVYVTDPAGKAPGVYTFDTANQALRLFHLASTTSDLRTYAQALTVGRVAWTDNTTTGSQHSLGARDVAGDASALTVGPVQRLSPAGHDTLGVLAADSRILRDRTYVYSANGAVATTAVALPLQSHESAYDMSGTRVLADRPREGMNPAYSVLDLSHGTRTDLTKYDMTQASLWGNYVVFTRATDLTQETTSDWRLDLVTGDVTQLAPTHGSDNLFSRVFAFGDYAAWDDEGGVSIRNVRTMAPAIKYAFPGGSGGVLYHASTNGIIVFDIGDQQTRLVSWGGRATMNLFSDDDQIDGNIHLWNSDLKNGATVNNDANYDSDANHTGNAFAAPVPAAARVANQPRSLGNPLGGTSASPTAPWKFDLPTSAVLTTCSVVIRNAAGNAVRTLTCNRTMMAYGEAAVRWDGTAPGGLPAGRYTYVVRAANTGGTLLAADGTTAPITGTIQVGG